MQLCIFLIAFDFLAEFEITVDTVYVRLNYRQRKKKEKKRIDR